MEKTAQPPPPKPPPQAAEQGAHAGAATPSGYPRTITFANGHSGPFPKQVTLGHT